MALNPRMFTNLGKSVAYSSLDVMSKLAPSTFELGRGVRSGIDVTRDFLRSNQTKIKNITATSERSSMARKAKNFIDDALNDIKQGNLSLGDLSSQSFDDWNDFDFGDDFSGGGSDQSMDFGDDDDGGSSGGSFGGYGQAPKKPVPTDFRTLKGMQEMTDVVSKTQLKSAQFSTSQITTAIFSQMASQNQHFLQIEGELSSINKNLEQLINFQSESQATSNQASLAFYDQMSNFMKKIEEREHKRSERTLKNKRSAAANLLLSGGFDLDSYKEVIQDNIYSSPLGMAMSMMSFLDPSMLGMMFGSDGMGGKFQPQKYLLKAGLNLLMPGQVRRSMKRGDDQVQTMLKMMLGRLGDMRYETASHPILGTLGSIFGIDTRAKRSLDVSGFKRGDMNWNGEAQKALVNVIPKELAEIKAILADKPAEYYDMSTGTYQTEEQVREHIKKVYEQAVEAPLANLFNQFSMGADDTRNKELWEGMDESLKKIVDQQINAAIESNEGMNEKISQRLFTALALGVKNASGTQAGTELDAQRMLMTIANAVNESRARRQSAFEEMESSNTAFTQLAPKLANEWGKISPDKFIEFIGGGGVDFIAANSDEKYSTVSGQRMDEMTEEDKKKIEQTENMVRNSYDRVRRMVESDNKIISKLGKTINNVIDVRNGSRGFKYGDRAASAVDRVFGRAFNTAVLGKNGRLAISPTMVGDDAPLLEQFKDIMSFTYGDFENNDISDYIESITGGTDTSTTEPSVDKFTLDPAEELENAQAMADNLKNLRDMMRDIRSGNPVVPRLPASTRTVDVYSQNDLNETADELQRRLVLDRAINDTIDFLHEQTRQARSRESSQSPSQDEEGEIGDDEPPGQEPIESQDESKQSRFRQAASRVGEYVTGAKNRILSWGSKATSSADPNAGAEDEQAPDEEGGPEQGKATSALSQKDDSQASKPRSVVNQAYADDVDGSRSRTQSEKDINQMAQNDEEMNGKEGLLTKFLKHAGLTKFLNYFNNTSLGKAVKRHKDNLKESLKKVFTEDYTDEDGNVQKGVFHTLHDAGVKYKDMVFRSLGINPDTGEPDDGSEQDTETVVGAAHDAAQAINEVTEEVAGSQEERQKKDTKSKKIMDALSKAVKKYARGIGLGGTIGAIGGAMMGGNVGLIGGMFLPGGPIGGAILGMSLGFLGQTNTVKNILFGKVDDQSGERQGGLISKGLQDGFKKLLPSIGLGAGAGMATKMILGMLNITPKTGAGGAILSTLLPGGVMGAAILGSAGAMALKNQKVQDILFGKIGDDGQRSGTILSGMYNKFTGKIQNGEFGDKTKHKSIKGKLGKMVKGAIGGLSTYSAISNMGIIGSAMGFAGPIGAAIAGSAIAIATSGDKFNDYLYGQDLGDGKRGKDGLISQFQNALELNFVEPAKHWFENTAEQFAWWAKEKIEVPFRLAFGPIIDTFRDINTSVKDAIVNAFKSAGSSIAETVNEKVIRPVGGVFMKYILRPLGSLAGGMLKAGLFGAASAIGTPLNVLSGIVSPAKKKANKALDKYIAIQDPDAFLQRRWDRLRANGEEVDDAMMKRERMQYRLGSMRFGGGIFRNNDVFADMVGEFKGTEEGQQIADSFDWMTAGADRTRYRNERKKLIEQDKEYRKRRKYRRRYADQDKHNEDAEWSPTEFAYRKKEISKKLGIDIEDAQEMKQFIYHYDDWMKAKNAPQTEEENEQASEETQEQQVDAQQETTEHIDELHETQKESRNILKNIYDFITTGRRARGGAAEESDQTSSPNAQADSTTQVQQETLKAVQDSADATRALVDLNTGDAFDTEDVDHGKISDQIDETTSEKIQANDMAQQGHAIVNAFNAKEEEERRRAEHEQVTGNKSGNARDEEVEKDDDGNPVIINAEGSKDSEQSGGFLSGIMSFLGSGGGIATLVAVAGLVLSNPEIRKLVGDFIGSAISALPDILMNGAQAVKDLWDGAMGDDGGINNQRAVTIDEETGEVTESIQNRDLAKHGLSWVRNAAQAGLKVVKNGGKITDGLTTALKTGVSALPGGKKAIGIVNGIKKMGSGAIDLAKKAGGLVNKAGKAISDSPLGQAVGRIGKSVWSGTKNKAASVASAAGKAVLDGPLGKGLTLVREALEGACKSKVGTALGGIIKKLTSFIDDILNAVKKKGSEILEKYAPKLSAAMGESGAKLASNAAVPLAILNTAISTGETLDAVFNPEMLFMVDKKDVDWKMRVIAGILQAAMSFSCTGAVVGIISDLVAELMGVDFIQSIACIIYNAMSDDEDDAALDKAIADMRQEVANYNEANGTNLSVNAYNDLKNKGFFGGMWNGIKNIFGAGDKTDYSQYSVEKYQSKYAADPNLGNDPNVQASDFGSGKSSGSGSVGYGPGPLMQNDQRWGNKELGYFPNGEISTMATGGCGFTALADAANHVGYGADPSQIADFAGANGMIADGGATSDLFTKGANKLGLNSQQLGDKSAIAENLMAGNPVIMSGKSPAGYGSTPYTGAGHIVTATGMDMNGNVTVDDPMRGQGVYNIDDLANNMTGAWSIGSKSKKTAAGYGLFDSIFGGIGSAVLSSVMQGLGLPVLSGGNDSGETAPNATDEDTTGTTKKSSGGSSGGSSNSSKSSGSSSSGQHFKGLGSISAKYESNGNPATVSGGAGDAGGRSFGSYQFASFGNTNVSPGSHLYDFWAGSYMDQYPGVTPGNNEAFVNAWKDAANKDPEGFAQKEHDYITDKYYNPMVNKNMSVMDPNQHSRAAQELWWSTAVQYGPSNNIMKNALNGVDGQNMPTEDLINKITDYKVADIGVGHFKKCSTAVQNGVRNRFDKGERNDLLAIADQGPIDPDDPNPNSKPLRNPNGGMTAGSGNVDVAYGSGPMGYGIFDSVLGSMGQVAIQHVASQLGLDGAMQYGSQMGVENAGPDTGAVVPTAGKATGGAASSAGGSTATTTNLRSMPVSDQQQALVDKMRSIQGTISYTTSGAQDPDKGTASCASTVAWAYDKVLGFKPGGSGFARSTVQATDDQFETIYNNDGSNEIDFNQLQPGDIVYMHWDRTNNNNNDVMKHTEMYAGDGTNLSHGGNPALGPAVKQFQDPSAGKYRRDHTMLIRRYKGFMQQPTGRNPNGGMTAGTGNVDVAYGPGPSSSNFNISNGAHHQFDTVRPQHRPMGYGAASYSTDNKGVETRLDTIINYMRELVTAAANSRKPAEPNPQPVTINYGEGPKTVKNEPIVINAGQPRNIGTHDSGNNYLRAKHRELSRAGHF